MRLASVVPIVAIALTGVGLDLHRSQAADLLGPAPPPRGYGFDYAPVPSESAPIPPASVYEAPRYVVPGAQGLRASHPNRAGALLCANSAVLLGARRLGLERLRLGAATGSDLQLTQVANGSVPND